MIVALSVGRDAPPEVRARVALDEASQRATLRAGHPDLRELAILSTCHRTEIYAVAAGPDAGALHAMVSLLPGLAPGDHTDVRFLRDDHAVEHLFRVGCGLDSLVIGEPQILGQVRRALVYAQQEGAAGALLTNVFARAIRLGKRARTDTMLGSFGTSIGELTARHLAGALGDLTDRRAAIVGAGEAAADAARALADAGARIAVLGRTASSTERLAAAVGGSAHPLDDMADVLARADCGVVAVGGGALVRGEHLRPRRAPLVLVDISVPPSVDVVGRDDVTVRTLEDLEPRTGPDTAAAVADAEAMVAVATADFARWSRSRATSRGAGDLRAHAERVVAGELDRTLASMDLTDAERERIASLAYRIAGKLLHAPTVAMRDADPEANAMLRRAFGLDPQ